MSDSLIAATTQARIIRRRMLADGILGLTLERIDGEPLAAADAGAHIDLHLPNGLVRQYSLSNAPTGRAYELGVLLDPGGRGGSICVHEDLREGEVLTIGAPRNLFRLVAGARRSLLVAGGIGITPIISMADTLHAAGKAFELHYCCRSASRAAYRDRLGSAAYADRVRFYYDDAPQDGRLIPMRCWHRPRKIWTFMSADPVASWTTSLAAPEPPAGRNQIFTQSGFLLTLEIALATHSSWCWRAPAAPCGSPRNSRFSTS